MGNRSPGWRIPENHPRGRITVQSLATSPCSRAIGRSSVRPIWPKGTTLSASAPPHPHSLLPIYGVALLSLGSPLSEFSSCGLAIRSRLFFGNLSFFTPRSTPQPRPPNQSGMAPGAPCRRQHNAKRGPMDKWRSRNTVPRPARCISHWVFGDVR
jgi:hypothetical protein